MKIGSTSIASVFKGNTEVAKVYRGTSLVYENTTTGGVWSVNIAQNEASLSYIEGDVKIGDATFDHGWVGTYSGSAYQYAIVYSDDLGYWLLGRKQTGSVFSSFRSSTETSKSARSLTFSSYTATWSAS